MITSDHASHIAGEIVITPSGTSPARPKRRQVGRLPLDHEPHRFGVSRPTRTPVEGQEFLR